MMKRKLPIVIPFLLMSTNAGAELCANSQYRDSYTCTNGQLQVGDAPDKSYAALEGGTLIMGSGSVAKNIVAENKSTLKINGGRIVNDGDLSPVALNIKAGSAVSKNSQGVRQLSNISVLTSQDYRNDSKSVTGIYITASTLIDKISSANIYIGSREIDGDAIEYTGSTNGDKLIVENSRVYGSTHGLTLTYLDRTFVDLSDSLIAGGDGKRINTPPSAIFIDNSSSLSITNSEILGLGKGYGIAYGTNLSPQTTYGRAVISHSKIYNGVMFSGTDINSPSIVDNNAILLLREGTILTGGNNNAINVQNDRKATETSSAFINPDNSTIIGKIFNSPDTYLALSLTNNANVAGDGTNISRFDIDSSSKWYLASDSSVKDLTNAGVIAFNKKAAGHTLTVTGNYKGTGGTLIMNTALAGDDSVTDKLLVNGNTSGTAYIQVNNLGGQGAQTINGIELVRVQGLSDGEFRQRGRIVAGAYDYYLRRGEAGNAGNWYLTSSTGTAPPSRPVPPVFPIIPPETITPPVAPLLPLPPQPPVITPPQVSLPPLRPEAGSYLSGLVAMRDMFDLQLSDRSGEKYYVDAFTGETRRTTMWLRTHGEHRSSRDSTGQLDNRSNQFVSQLGGDIARIHLSEDDALRIGLMAGYGYSHNNTTSRETGSGSRSTVDGYSAGIYATWLEHDDSLKGTWVDSWIQHNWFSNNVKGNGIPDESYDARGVSASLEAGYSIPVMQSKETGLYLQPQGQIIWSSLDVDTHRESNGTVVKNEDRSNVHTRLGMKMLADIATGKAGQVKPYIEVNWLHNSGDEVISMDGESIRQEGQRNVGELKIGADFALSDQTHLWSGVSQQMGTDHYRSTVLSLGIKYAF